MAREFGKTPLQLAHEDGLACDKFYDGLSPYERIGIDHHILNRLISEENEARKQQMEDADRQKRMPGVTRMVSASERSEQLKEMRGG